VDDERGKFVSTNSALRLPSRRSFDINRELKPRRTLPVAAQISKRWLPAWRM
jgi:hypothetical protein